MKIEEIDIESIKPYDKNPRNNQAAIEKVAESIKKFGFNQNIVVREQDMTICAGHTRYYASLLLKKKTIPAYVKPMTEIEFKAYLIADNKTSDYAAWDTDVLTKLLKKLEEDNPALLLSTGMSDLELEALLEENGLDDLIDDEIEVSGHKRATPSEKSHVKMIQLFFDDVKFGKFIQMLEDIQPEVGTSNFSDTTLETLERVEGEI